MSPLSPSPSVECEISGKPKAVSLFNTPEPDELEPNSDSELTKRKNSAGGGDSEEEQEEKIVFQRLPGS
jgi:hypothetical protein